MCVCDKKKGDWENGGKRGIKRKKVRDMRKEGTQMGNWKERMISENNEWHTRMMMP